MSGSTNIGSTGVSLAFGTGSGGGGGGPGTLADTLSLPTSYVLVGIGDSQWKGTVPPADATSYYETYVTSPNIKVLDAGGNWVMYDPANGRAGVDFIAGNYGEPGFEAGYISAWRENFGETPLYIAKNFLPGSTASKNQSTYGAQIIGSISGNILTVTTSIPAQDAALQGGGTLIVGTGIPEGTYVDSWLGGNSYQVYRVGLSGAFPPLSVPGGTLMGLYSVFFSWSALSGGLYLGFGGIPNLTGFRGKLTTALAKLANPRIITWVTGLGSNDSSFIESATTFSNENVALLNRISADFNLSSAQIVMANATFGAFVATVTAAQLANKNLAPTRRKLFPTNTYTPWDGVHFPLVDVTDFGRKAFGATFGTEAGL